MTTVHPRVHKRHPEIEDADVVWAWDGITEGVIRDIGEREVRIGFDSRGRELEMVGVLKDGEWFVYHAMTPPSKKTKSEIDKGRRNK